ncbi:hypothetical protein CV102_06470 [Natronococcus pandeyae]|uniref:DUF5518 domain-containing protein n=1 Tax=Natronococcus pandeyae TaxID=2055836 RepID=A0A8J8Q772_9EURY|nr:DUF5518 domain-containing protein [Natronococcus pandeyae]TYL39913.1 hypothetical protein CV102_06470 [Natronococcus pandeyae]
MKDHSTNQDSRKQSTRSQANGTGAVTESTSRLSAIGVGAAVVLFSGYIFPIFGQIVGGIASGYLRGCDRRESAITGGLAAALATMPGLLLVFGIVFFLFSPLSFDPGSMLVLFGIIAFFYVALIAIAAGIGALGGVIGATVTNRSAPTNEKHH